MINDVIAQGNLGDAALYLVEKGANANDVYLDDGGEPHSLLMDAIVVENIPFVELLVKHGADVSVTDEQGITTLIKVREPYMREFYFTSCSTAAATADGGNKRGQECSCVAYLDIEDESRPKSTMGNRTVPIYLFIGSRGVPHWCYCQAAHRGMLSICELLLDKEVDVEAMSEDGFTALIAGASGGHAHIVELLLEKGKANPNARDKVHIG